MLGHSYCRFQEALDRLSDQDITENHPIIQRHQRSCRKISGRQAEKRDRDCRECSRVANVTTEPGKIDLGNAGIKEEAIEAADGTSCPDDEDSEECADEMSIPADGDQGTDPGYEMPKASLTEPKAEPQLSRLQCSDPECKALARKASDCGTCSSANATVSDEPWSSGDEVWNEGYEGERATCEVFERPRGEDFRVVDVAVAAAVARGGRGEEGEEEMGGREKEEIEGIEVEMGVIPEAPESAVGIPKLRRKRKSLSLRGKV
jgi:hypothetical protein